VRLPRGHVCHPDERIERCLAKSANLLGAEQQSKACVPGAAEIAGAFVTSLLPRARRGSALVTGASSGIGRAIALRLSSVCDELLLVGRNSERLREVASMCQQSGARAECFIADFADRSAAPQLAQLARLALADRAALSVLVHSAGAFASGPMEAARVDDFDLALDVNLRAPFVLTRALFPLIRAGRGDVVFINSRVVGERRSSLAAFAASKQGLVGLADSLRQELAPSGVRVLSVFLGETSTPPQAPLHEPTAEQSVAGEAHHEEPGARLAADDVARAVCDAIDLPRSAEVTDLQLRPAVLPRSE
jgi:NAD(P)-dependent dehydrogenase (short-subunit alcohol dehydrogenase family)